MRDGIHNELDYLGSIDRDAKSNSAFAEELVRRLDALRRYDQDFDESDWRPHRQPDSPLRSG
jgi:hypothetical protein